MRAALRDALVRQLRSLTYSSRGGLWRGFIPVLSLSKGPTKVANEFAPTATGTHIKKTARGSRAVCRWVTARAYLLWQVRQIWLPALVSRRKLTRPVVTEVLCGSWQLAHSTQGVLLAPLTRV